MANRFGNELAILNGVTNAVIGSLAVTTPAGVAVDPLSGRIYVTSQRTAALVVLG